MQLREPTEKLFSLWTKYTISLLKHAKWHQ